MTWQRLEGTTIDPDLVEGQEARIADPLWLLARQWQTGELTGDDAGSPIVVEALLQSSPITRFQPGPPGGRTPVLARDALGLPLEVAVEREAVRTGPAALRLAAEAGLQLYRMLDGAGAPATARASLRQAHPLRLDADDGLDPFGRRQLELLARRSFDARELVAATEDGAVREVKELRAGPGAAALAAWRTWYAGLFSEPPDGAGSWDPARMEYRFRMAARPDERQPEVVLDAPEYAGGHLDWYAFDARPDLGGLGAPAAGGTRPLRVLPAPARYAGQAASRFWQVEDGHVWFGDFNVAPGDLARVAVASFGMSFGDDWFLFPCRLAPGSIARVARLTVRDTFGRTHELRSCAERDGPGRAWRLFELTGDASADAPEPAQRRCPWLLLPPVLAGVTESKPVEEVLLLRDEVANLGWAAEVRVESAAGRIVDRAARARAERQPPPTAADEAWLYRLSTDVLDHQVPLAPVRSGADGALYLQRGRLATAATGGAVTTRGAVGRILEPDRPLLIEDGEVPATGARVTRSWQLARLHDGGLILWMGRRKTPAPPRRSPGLIFDDVRREP
jgi:hypothetical protein